MKRHFFNTESDQIFFHGGLEVLLFYGTKTSTIGFVPTRNLPKRSVWVRGTRRAIINKPLQNYFIYTPLNNSLLTYGVGIGKSGTAYFQIFNQTTKKLKTIGMCPLEARQNTYGLILPNHNYCLTDT